MGVHDWRSLSLGEWAAICRGWNKAHGQSTVDAPSDAEFEAAVLAARGM